MIANELPSSKFFNVSLNFIMISVSSSSLYITEILCILINDILPKWMKFTNEYDISGGFLGRVAIISDL